MPEDQSTPKAIEYKAVPNFPNYMVGDDGSVWCCSKYSRRKSETMTMDGVVWKRVVRRNRQGYPQIRLCRDGKLFEVKVHSLLLEIFVGPRPEGLLGTHKNDVKGDNRICNLEWGTHKKNAADRDRNGRTQRGESHSKAKLSAEQVIEIRGTVASGEKKSKVARRYKITRTNVWAIVSRKIWRHVP